MKIFKFSFLIFASLFFLNLTSASVNAQLNGIVITVNSANDSNDANPGDQICADSDGQCTLRAAIQEANAAVGGDVIIFNLPKPSTVELTIGQLSITRGLSIVGTGARNLVVQRSSNAQTPEFRIFNVAENAGNVTLRNLTIKNGRTFNSPLGGGINVERGNVVNLIDVAITDNRAIVGGGIANAATVNLNRCLLNSNVANSQGGAIANLDGLSSTSITNSTITNNSADTAGGVNNNGKLLLINDTVTNNSAINVASSIFNNSGGTANVLNTIVGYDVSPVNTLQGAFASLGNNIVTDARGSTGFVNGTNNDQVSDNNVINLQLGNLANNGGQTDTRALLNGSPAINAGNNCVRNNTCSLPLSQFVRLSSDQRVGYSRSVGAAVDIGAFEAGSTTINANISFGARSLGGRRSMGFAILTSATTGEKKYSSINPFGSYSFQNLSYTDVYVLELRNKRQPFAAPQIITFDGIPLFGFFTEIREEK